MSAKMDALDGLGLGLDLPPGLMPPPGNSQPDPFTAVGLSPPPPLNSRPNLFMAVAAHALHKARRLFSAVVSPLAWIPRTCRKHNLKEAPTPENATNPPPGKAPNPPQTPPTWTALEDDETTMHVTPTLAVGVPRNFVPGRVCVLSDKELKEKPFIARSKIDDIELERALPMSGWTGTFRLRFEGMVFMVESRAGCDIGPLLYVDGVLYDLVYFVFYCPSPQGVLTGVAKKSAISFDWKHRPFERPYHRKVKAAPHAKDGGVWQLTAAELKVHPFLYHGTVSGIDVEKSVPRFGWNACFRVRLGDRVFAVEAARTYEIGNPISVDGARYSLGTRPPPPPPHSPKRHVRDLAAGCELVPK